jgi:hypothetical protein
MAPDLSVPLPQRHLPGRPPTKVAGAKKTTAGEQAVDSRPAGAARAGYTFEPFPPDLHEEMNKCLMPPYE